MHDEQLDALNTEEITLATAVEKADIVLNTEDFDPTDSIIVDGEIHDVEELLEESEELEDAKVVEQADVNYPAGDEKEPTLREKVAQIIKGVMLHGVKKGWHPEDLINYGVDLAQQGYKPQQIRKSILDLKAVQYYAQKKTKVTTQRTKRNKKKKASKKSKRKNR